MARAAAHLKDRQEPETAQPATRWSTQTQCRDTGARTVTCTTH